MCLKTQPKQNLREASGVDVLPSIHQRATSHSLQHRGCATAHSALAVVQGKPVFFKEKQLYLEKESLNCTYTARGSVSQLGSKTRAA